MSTGWGGGFGTEPAIITIIHLAALFSIFCALLLASPSEARPPPPTGAAVLHELNLARQQPRLYANIINQLRGQFRGKLLVLPGGTLLRTHEGVAAIDDAIRFLRSVRPFSPLQTSAGLSKAAAEHVADQARGAFGHGGSDHSNPGARLSRYGVWSGRWGENISYGKSTARDIVVALIVDDGLRGRKHRKNIFNSDFHFAGAAVGPHAHYRTVCSIDFAGGYAERDQPTTDPLFAQN